MSYTAAGGGFVPEQGAGRRLEAVARSAMPARRAACERTSPHA